MNRIIAFILPEKPTIVEFADGKFGIRKKLPISNLYFYLDIMDYEGTRPTVNWRYSLHRDSVYSWCARSSLGEIKKVHERLTTFGHKKKKHVNSIKLSQEEIDKRLFINRLADSD